MVSKKRREEGADRYYVGTHAENNQYWKDKLDPRNESVERHSRPNSPYDYKVVRKTGWGGLYGKKKTTYVEVKSGNATQSKQEKDFQAQHPRSYELKRVDGENFRNDVRQVGKFLRKIDDETSDKALKKYGQRLKKEFS